MRQPPREAHGPFFYDRHPTFNRSIPLGGCRLPVYQKQCHNAPIRSRRVTAQGPTMTELSPSQRTASTARILLTAGALFAVEAIVQSSVPRTVIASLLLTLGGGLWFFAKNTD